MTAIKGVGFVGVGLMGGSFARNLLKAGFEVRGFDPSPAAGEALVEAGGKTAATPRAAGEGVQLVIVMAPDTPHIEASLNGEDGLFSDPGDGRIVMVMSTIDPGAVDRFAADAKSAGWRYVDCPVGRTGDDARAGNSMFMLGGAAEDKSAVTPVLETIGTSIVDCGEVGHAMTVKIVNNFMSTAGAVITAEALRLAESRGVSADVALSVVNGTIATNGHAKVHFPNKVLQGDLRPGFAVKHARKDIDIARTVMERDGFPCFVAPGALAAYDAAIDAGRADDDWSVLYEVVEEIWKKAKK